MSPTVPVEASSDGTTPKEKSSYENSIDDKGEAGSYDGKPPLGVPLEKPTGGIWNRWRKRPKVNLDAIATQPSVFDDPIKLEVYRPPPQYENAHRFDPDARWTWREEKRVVRKIDRWIMIWAIVMFFSLDLDRSNISQANTDNFLDDLNLNTNDFNLGNSLFRITFLIAELPSQLISKRVGPDIWIPTQMTLWSIVALCQFWLKGRASFLAFRCILGFLQGGFIPDVVLYLSYFYTKSELPIRLAFFWVSNYLADIISAFLATAILKMRGVGGLSGWRYLFLLEGILTLCVGLISFAMMPAGPTQTKAWYRPKGWFNEKEETIMVNRILRDDPTKSDMHNREGLSPRMILKALQDWRLWPIYVVGLTHMMPVGPPQTYLTLSLRNLGFNTTESNLLSIPSTIIGMTTMVLAAFFSEMVNSRVAATIILQVWALPLLVALYTFDRNTSQWVYYAVVTLVTGFPYVHPIQVAWASTNSYSVGNRTVSASAYNMPKYIVTRTSLSVCGFSLLAGTVLETDHDFVNDIDKAGNRVLIGICSMNIVLYISIHFFYKYLNKRRDKTWNSWSKEEQRNYLENTKDQGSKRLDFRFAY
ncbi:hypothetical protein V5O48_006725 [Marasmius crinis-equi]|uniref:Major facilitator superfamily (MFS) profile domain-containing protein n=1 Tax=Marasmius crinis-equi TaxID=585013 RepID=A0ABR3FIQ2_9AGAR